MHALCTIVTKSIAMIYRFIDNKCVCGDWDYASIGGRYGHIIPVSKKVKDIHEDEIFPFNDDGCAENGFPYHDIENNLNYKYVSIARVRNIKRNEVERINNHHLINPFNPYSYILEEENGGQGPEYIVDYHGTGMLMDFINDPRHSGYYVAVIDYHF